MMKAVKTAELSGNLLNYAVLLALGEYADGFVLKHWDSHCAHNLYQYTTDWAIAGPIIQDCRMTIIELEGDDDWRASMWGVGQAFGSTQLEAAMRLFVLFKLGKEVIMPVDELTRESSC